MSKDADLVELRKVVRSRINFNLDEFSPRNRGAEESANDTHEHLVWSPNHPRRRLHVPPPLIDKKAVQLF
jgi:hypothetical protein